MISTRLRRALACLLMASVVLLGGMQTADAGRRGKVRAKRIYKKATRLYNVGRFEKALAAFSKAYEVSGHAGFLFNIGQCHKQLGQPDQALFFFRSFMREQPDSRMTELVETLIAELEAEVEEAKERERAAAEAEARRLAAATESPDEQPDVGQEAGRVTPAEQIGAAPASAQPAMPPDANLTLAAAPGDMAVAPSELLPPAEEPAFYERWWFWTAVAGVVAVAGGTTAALMMSKGDSGSGSIDRLVPDTSLGYVDARP